MAKEIHIREIEKGELYTVNGKEVRRDMDGVIKAQHPLTLLESKMFIYWLNTIHNS